MRRRKWFFSEETWRKRKDGTLFWAHVAITALRGDDRNLLGFSKITLDLTKHRLLEDCVKEKEEINFILQAANSGTWKWNVGTNQINISKNFLQLLGYADYESVLTVDECIKFIHPSDRKSICKQLQAIREQSPKSNFEAAVRICRQDGNYHWFYVRADWRRQIDDAPTMLMGVCVDIHSLKMAEEERERLYHQLRDERIRFAHILEQMPSGVILTEAPSGKLTYQNRTAEKMLGRGLDAINSYRDYGSYNFLGSSSISL
ncbi:MAG: PAS domain S-box protein [Pseudomonadota bacterium]